MTTALEERPAPPVERHAVLHTYVDAFTVESLVDHLDAAVRRRTRHLVANHNVNSLSLLERSASFRAFYDRADAVFVDGMPVVLLARLSGSAIGRRNRVAVLDWIWPLAARAETNGWHVVHVGGDERTNAAAASELQARHPHLRLTTIDGYFDQRRGAPENTEVLARLRAAAPDLLLVGMGMPRQEAWVLDNVDDLPPCPIVTVGGILGYLGGDRPTPPRWLGALGIEWLFRVLTEPRRLWRRYLLEPLVLVPAVLTAIGRTALGRS